MKTLSRPMFRRGGGVSAKNNGIVSGFSGGGNVRQKYANSDPAGVQDGAMKALMDAGLLEEPVRQTGFSQSDWLRLAAAGADIMGATPTGRGGVIGALQAAGPALGSLGRDLGTSMGEREAIYQAKLDAQNKIKQGAVLTDYELDKKQVNELAKLGAAQTWESTEAQLDRDQETTQNNLDRISAEAIAEKDKLKITTQIEQYYEQKKILSNPNSTDDERAAAQDLLDIIQEDKTKLRNELIIAAQTDPNTYQSYDTSIVLDELDRILQKEADKEELTKEEKDFKKKFINKDETSIQKQLAMDDINNVFESMASIDFAKGGRVGFANGGGAYEERYREKQLDPGPMEPGNLDPEQYPQQAQASGVTFEELRARLPKEVSDGVVKLIATSEEALLDFANIETQEDISLFNQKYNTDLTLPSQVA